MNALAAMLTATPVRARVAPFIVFVLLTFCQDWFGPAGRYFVYLLKTVVVAWMLWAVRAVVTEMRWRVSWEAVAVGAGVFVLWVGLDPLFAKLGLADSYPKLKLSGPPWNPMREWGDGAGMAWFFIVVRVAGSSIIVPMLEEVFFRSFLYRFIANPDFEREPLGRFAWKPFLITSAIFALEHREWLAGLLCGFAYQWLVCRKQRLGDAITAHAITNLLLGLWVVWRGAWHFW
jgi:hypothetical protein